MSYTFPGGLGGPRPDEHLQPLTYKVAAYLAGVISGSVGFLVRGTVATTSPTGDVVTRTGFTSGLTASQTLLAANTDRLYFTVDNRTGKDVFLRKGSANATTAVGGYDIRVPSGFSVSDDSWTGQVTFICDTGAAATGVNVSEVSTS